ncbi:tyrosine-protein phosphatase [Solirubrobacter sp. CPCC 204708]|uniref:Tyrosine-protein phosphatase n=1 Tax=Solirubrobacter deserti TaxID=2282478 RepID=A0ABT4RET2_9ACTN|nr:tyrosine-protein phosphatase [Solirubrobacter deserti]MBE2318570.1 tyrosine-protein phosphatase [Solirubrobacter deserti]MDA0137028.1 tyrosine-protein phosphatase [Solirubrobacter deserti]
MRAWVDLEGAANVRDVGGLPVEGGGVTASGVLIRSDNLQGLSAADIVRLVDELGVGVVVDLRTAYEIDREGPGPLVADGRVEIRHRDLYFDQPERGKVVFGADDELPFVNYYLRYLDHRPDSVLAALNDIAEGPGAVLVHCAAGKDRTGMIVALALSAVGVERDAIVADYVATAERITPIMARLRASETYRADLEPYTDASRAPRADVMESVLAALDEHHGGAAGWLAEQGFDPAPLRARLLG